MVTRRKKSVRTHAVALWSIVGICVVLLVMMSAYVALVTRISAGTRLANSSQNTAGTATQPSLFGTVVTILASDAISIESKQPFDTVLIDEITKISALGGSPFQWSDLRPGATLTATGKDLGDGRMTANAIVVLANPGTALPIIGAPTENDAAPEDVVAAIGTGSRQLTAPFTLARNDGSKSSKITPTETSNWWLSADEKTLLNIESVDQGMRRVPTPTTYDLSTRHIVE